MQKLKHNIKLFSNGGFTIIEALVVLSIFSIILVTFYSTFTLGTQYIIDAKNRLGAVSLANQKMEIIRNIQYDDIGTLTGVPQGVLDDDYYENVNTVNYRVKTDISYVDDTFDSTVDDTDVIPTDYKTVRVTILWGDESSSRRAYLLSDFVPPGVETSAGGGTLRVNVIDTSGNGISGASVNISSASEGINISTSTDSAGSVLRPGMPAANDYVVSVSKEDYESVTTLPVSPDSDYDPVIDQNATVIEGSLNIKSIVIDPLSDIRIKTEDPFGNAVSDIDFNLTGGRYLGVNVSGGIPGFDEYNYLQDLTTNSSGEESVDNVSPGEYTFTLSADDSVDYEFFKVDSGSDIEIDSFALNAGILLNVKAILLDRLVNSVAVSVTSLDDESPIEGASVNLKNVALSYDTTLITDKYGKVYFPESATPLVADSYELSISATGYDDSNSTVSVSGLEVVDEVLTSN